MANFEIPENPEYSEKIRKFEEEDPGHADLFNAVVETLLGNEVFLKKLADSLAKRISGLDTLTKYTTVQTPNPSIGAQIVQKESETFDLDGDALPFPIQEVVAGHEKAISQLNTDTTLRFTKNFDYVAFDYCEIKGKNGIYKFRIYIECKNLPASYEAITIGTINSKFLTNTIISLPSKNNDIWFYVDTEGVVKIRCPQGGTYSILADAILY